MNASYELIFLLCKVFIVVGTLWLLFGIGIIVHERYWQGHVDAFKPERRVGPEDRRVGSGA